MNKIISTIRSRPPWFYLVIFLMMIAPGVLLFFVAEGDSQIGMTIFLSLIVLGNSLTAFS